MNLFPYDMLINMSDSPNSYTHVCMEASTLCQCLHGGFNHVSVMSFFEI